MPSSKTSSEYWIDGSHRETALEDFYVVGPELGRYRLLGGAEGAGEGTQEPTLHGSVGRGRDGGADEGGWRMEKWGNGGSPWVVS